MDERPTTLSEPELEPEHEPEHEPEQLTPYLRYLLVFICVASFFEAYDVMIINLSLPFLGEDFQVDAQTLAFAVSAVSLGTIAGFLPVRLADRYGRRPVLLAVIAGYTLFTVATAFSTDIYSFVGVQFIARMCMVAEVGIGAIILTEEMPARFRGRAISLMLASGFVGGLFASLGFPYLVKTDLGWRMLYLVGGMVLPPLFIYRNRLRETRRWLEQRNRDVELASDSPNRKRKSFFQVMRDTRIIFERRYRRSLIAGTSIWFLTNFWASVSLFFFTYYVIQERGWGPELVGKVIPIAALFSIAGFLAVGPLLDIVGRRITAGIFFSIGGISSVVCFQAESTWVIAIAYVFVMVANAVWAISATVTSEIFPTAIRATGNAVVNNLFGRTGMVIGPALVGILSKSLGSVGNAVAVLALFNFLLLPVILYYLRETKGQVLEDISV